MAGKKNTKTRKIGGRFIGIPFVVLAHPDYISLNYRAVKLLIDLCMQYNGFNNGDLCASVSVMKSRGWSSCDQLDKAKKELVKKDFITVTRQGGRRCATLYALTWYSIDECKGKLDVRSTKVPPRCFTQK